MKNAVLILATLTALAACQKKPGEAPSADAQPSAPATTQAPAPAAEPTEADRERANKQAALDYATMEDTFLNDPKGQWAREAKASSVFGDSDTNGPSDVNAAQNLVGKPDGREWTNNQQDMGFDSIEATFEKPVNATEVRAVFRNGVS